MGRRSDAKPRIIQTAKKLFHERGYQAVGVSELCGASDVNKGSFYHFFPSKRHLLLEVLSGSWDETGILSSWLKEPPASPRRELRHYLRELFAFHYAEWEVSGYVRGSILGNLSAEIGTANEPNIVKELKRLSDQQRRAFRALLIADRKTGDFSTEDINRNADGLLASIQGLLLLAKIRNDLSVLPASESMLTNIAGMSD
tara:strand:+ start:6408 stop:7007 length:600 start_codon:yes stop_codon:yes gene_type:complete